MRFRTIETGMNLRIPDALLLVVATLTATGCVMVYSTTSVLDYAQGVTWSWILKHMAWVLLGALALIACRRTRLDWLQENARLIALVSILLLLLVFFPGLGARINGARRWIKLGFLTFQPSEVAKIAVLVFLADFLTRKAHLRFDFKRGFLPPVVLAGLVFLFVIVEPDFGTASLVLALTGIMLLLGGTRLSFLGYTGALALPLLGAVLIAAPYRVKRLMTFWDPWSDPEGKGYQVVQSMLALGRGGFGGVGLGNSNQKLNYLPSSYSDFIFAILGEEMGWLGAVLVLGLFAALLWLGWQAARRAPDAFSSLLAMGITMMLVLQAAINIAVVTASVPTKGIPLPFLSFGGSALVLNLAAAGILLRIADEGEKAEASDALPVFSPGASNI